MVFGSTVTTPATASPAAASPTTASPAAASPATASPATASLTANTNASPCSRNYNVSKFPWYILIQYFSFKNLKLVI